VLTLKALKLFVLLPDGLSIDILELPCVNLVIFSPIFGVSYSFGLAAS
jgi:hypothetical protein